MGLGEQILMSMGKNPQYTVDPPQEQPATTGETRRSLATLHLTKPLDQETFE